MSKKTRQIQRVWLIIGFVVLGYFAKQYTPGQQASPGNQYTDIAQIQQQQRSNVQVNFSSQVVQLLADDVEGRRHQKFIVQLASGKTILVAHNIDLAPRIDTLAKGDIVSLYGEYDWNDKGGVVHWTHHDPDGHHIDGWIIHNGQTYQ